MQCELIQENGIEVLAIRIPVSKRPSSSGKSMVVASTNGNLTTSIMVDGKPLVVGLNAYVKK